MHWLLHILGADDVSGRWYAWWSGAGSDVSELAILAGLAGLLRKHNCHVRGCWRIARHQVEGSPWTVCRKHHPDGAPTHQHVLRAHEEHKERLAAVRRPPGRASKGG